MITDVDTPVAELEAEIDRFRAELEQARMRERDLDDTRKATLCLLEDMEENRHQIERAKQQWNDAFDAVRDPIFIHDRDCRIIRANRAYAECAGMPFQEIIGRPYWKVFPKRDGPLRGCVHATQVVLAGKGPQQVNDEFELEDGTTFVSRAFAGLDTRGAYTYTVHVLEDVTERRKAEAERRTLGQALQQAGEGVVLTDRRFRITYVNPALCDMLGRCSRELVGSRAVALVPKDKRRVMAVAGKAAGSEEGWAGEIEVLAAGRARIPAYLNATAIRGEHGEVTGYVGTYLDLREIKENQRCTDILRAVIEDLSMEIDLDILGKKAVEAAVRLTGADAGVVPLLNEADGMLRHRWHCGLPPGIPMERFRQPYRLDAGLTGAVMATGQAQIVSDYRRFKGALPEYITLGVRSVVAIPLLIGGKLSGALVVASLKRAHAFEQGQIPILEAIARQLGVALRRRQLVDRVRASEERFRRMAETVPDILYRAMPPDFAVTYVSQALTDLLGFTPEEFTARPEQRVRQIHEDDRERVSAELKTALEEAEQFVIEYRMWHKDGKTLRWFEDRGAIKRDVRDRPVAVYGVMVDINVRKQAERQLEWDLKVNTSITELCEALLAQEALSIEEISHLVYELAKRLTASRHGYVGHIESQTGYLVCPTLSRDIWDACQVEDKSIVLKKFGGLLGWVLKNKKSVLANAPGDDPRSAGTPPGHIPIERFVSAPALIGEELVGQVSLANAERDYTERDLVLVEQLADFYALAIQRLRARQAIWESEERFRTVASSARDAILLVDNLGNVAFWNEAAEKMFGYTKAEAEGKPVHELIIPERFRDDHVKGFEAFSRSGKGPEIGKVLELPALRKGGAEFYAEHSISGVKLKGKWHAVGLVRDITERKQAEVVIGRVNRALRGMSACNEALIRAVDEMDLLQKICDVIVEVGEYRMAWVGYAEHDKRKTVRPLAGAGFEAGYLEGLDVIWADKKRGRGPTGVAIRSRKPYIARDIMKDPGFAPWRKAALERGYRSSIALPMMADGDVIGALNIYAEEADAFNTEEVKLLRELAADLSYGITALRTRAERQRVTRELGRSERSLAEAQQIAHLGNWDWDIGDNELRWSNEIYRIFGLSSREFGATYEAFLSTVHPDDRELVKQAIDNSLYKRKPYSIDHRILRPDGTERVVHEQAKVIFDEVGQPVRMLGTVQDVTERKRLEEERRRSAEQLQKTLVDTIQAMAMAVEKRDPYTAGHQQRVAELAAAIAAEMGLEEDRIQGIRLGATIHDVGKIYVPAEILSRPGRLTAAEFEIIKTHPEVGYEIIKGVEFPWPVADMILQHHERVDGSGYPQGLRAGAIILEAKIMAVADTVEAMASHRPYRPSRGLDVALAEIKRNKGGIYEPGVVAACLRLFREGKFVF